MPADSAIYTGMRPSLAFGGNFNELDQLSFLRQHPILERDAVVAGWRPDGRGNYTRQYNGMDQTVPAAMLVSMLEEQKQATALSQPVAVGGNYLDQN